MQRQTHFIFCHSYPETDPRLLVAVALFSFL